MQKKVLSRDRHGALCLTKPRLDDDEDEDEDEDEDAEASARHPGIAAATAAASSRGWRFDADDGGYGVHRPRYGLRGGCGLSLSSSNVVLD